LLARTDLGVHATPAIDFAMAWLKQFPLILEAQFVFNSLLARTDLGVHATPAIDFAMAWLKQFPLILEAGFVLPPLLARTDLGVHATPAIDFAMAWLKQFPLVKDAEFVVKRLFGHHSLSTDYRTECVLIALPLLERLGSSPEASHLLKGCLRDRAIDQESARLVVHYGLAWARSNPHEESADYIFNRLLRRPDLANDVWKELSDIALTWLRSYTSKENLDLTLAALLARPEQLKEQDLNWVVQEAEQWIRNQPKAAPTQNKLLVALERFHRLRRPQDYRKSPKDPGWIDNTVVEKLKLAVLGQTEVPNPRVLEEIINAMAAATDTSRPAPAAYPLPSLLALINPSTDPELWAKLFALARRILAHQKFLPHHREGLARAAWLLVDCGVWSEEVARPVLEELGLSRSSMERSI
jgi:hypothetical protein